MAKRYREGGKKLVSLTPEDLKRLGKTKSDVLALDLDLRMKRNPAAKVRPCRSCNRELHAGNRVRREFTKRDGSLGYKYSPFCKFCEPAIESNRRDSLIVNNELKNVPRSILNTGSDELPPSGDMDSEGIKRAQRKEANPQEIERKEITITDPDEARRIREQIRRIHKDVNVKRIDEETGEVVDVDVDAALGFDSEGNDIIEKRK